MTAANVDFVIDQGAHWVIQLYWTTYDNAPVEVLAPMRMEIRSSHGQVVAELIADEPPESDAYETILYNSDSGLIQLQLSSEKTALIPPGIYQYDLFVTYESKLEFSTARQHRLLHGRVSVQRRVTQVV